jgi:hypothetical protein
VNAGGEDLTVTCRQLYSQPDIKIRVIDCKGDCRHILGRSPNRICSESFGEGYWATSVDCELINIDDTYAPNGNYTRTFDDVWDDGANGANGWCEDTSDEDMTVTCQKFDSQPDIKVEVIECGEVCWTKGSPNEICKTIGYDRAIAVDCETVGIYSDGENLDRTFSQNLDWCVNGGGEDLTVTCTKDPLPLDCKDGASSDGLCHARCGADLKCEDVILGTGACSGCYYVDINNDGKVNIMDITGVAKRFGSSITGAFAAQTKTSLSIIFLLLTIIFVFIIFSIPKIFRK